MKYYMVGYMYSGKTTFGRKLAMERGMEFADLDQVFEQHYHYTVNDFFRRFGESAFRKLETQLLHTTSVWDNVVVATGGGTPCHSGNMDFIVGSGTAVYLKMTVDDLLRRAVRSHRPRPAMRGLTEQEIREKIALQLPIREPFYMQSQIVLDGNAPQLHL